jgi:hypothetical protein
MTVTAAIVLSGAGCGSQPAMCEDVESLQAALGRLSEVRLGEGAATAVSTELRNIRQDLGQLAQEAAEEYAPEIDAVQSAATRLVEGVRAAASAPSKADSLAELSDQAQALRGAVGRLADSVSGSC